MPRNYLGVSTPCRSLGQADCREISIGTGFRLLSNRRLREVKLVEPDGVSWRASGPSHVHPAIYPTCSTVKGRLAIMRLVVTAQKSCDGHACLEPAGQAPPLEIYAGRKGHRSRCGRFIGGAIIVGAKAPTPKVYVAEWRCRERRTGVECA